MNKKEKNEILDKIFIPKSEVIQREAREKIRGYDKLVAENKSLKVYVNELKEIMTSDLEIVADAFREVTKTQYDQSILVPIYWKIHDRIMNRLNPMVKESEAGK